MLELGILLDFTNPWNPKHPFINGWLSIGWWTKSLHRKWLEINKHPIKNGWKWGSRPVPSLPSSTGCMLLGSHQAGLWLAAALTRLGGLQEIRWEISRWLWLGGGNSNIFYFHPYLGKIPILTNIFQTGWNHQLVMRSWWNLSNWKLLRSG